MWKVRQKYAAERGQGAFCITGMFISGTYVLQFTWICVPREIPTYFSPISLFVDRVELASITGMIMIEKGLWYLTNKCWRDIYVMIPEELARVQTGKLLVSCLYFHGVVSDYAGPSPDFFQQFSFSSTSRATLPSLALVIWRVDNWMCLVCMCLVGGGRRVCACACVRAGACTPACAGLRVCFWRPNFKKPLCILPVAWSPARIKAAPWGMHKMCGYLSHVKCLWLCRAQIFDLPYTFVWGWLTMRAFLTSKLWVCVHDCVWLSRCFLLPDVSLLDFTALSMCWGMVTSYCAVMCAQVCVCDSWPGVSPVQLGWSFSPATGQGDQGKTSFCVRSISHTVSGPLCCGNRG